MHTEKNPVSNINNSILTRTFVLSFLSLFAFASAFSSLMPTLPIYLRRLGSNESEIGVLVGIFGVSSLISRFLVGAVLRRVEEKFVMIWGGVVFALTYVAFVILRGFWPFFMIRLLQGIAFASLDTAVMAYIIRLMPLHFRTRAINYLLLAPSLATAIAASTGMFLFLRYGPPILFFTCTALALCTILFASQLGNRKASPPDEVVPTDNKFFIERKIIAPAITNFLQWFIWGTIVAFFPLYALQCGVTNPGAFFSVNAVTILTARALGGMVLGAYNKEKIILTFLLTAFVALVLLSFSKTLPMFLLVAVLWGFGTAFFLPACMSYALEYACSSDGTAVGTYQASLDLGLAMGPSLMGLVIPFTGYRMMFLCLAGICVLNLCYFQFYVRRKAAQKA